MNMVTKKVENLPVYIFETRADMGAAAAQDAARRISDLAEALTTE